MRSGGCASPPAVGPLRFSSLHPLGPRVCGNKLRSKRTMWPLLWQLESRGPEVTDTERAPREEKKEKEEKHWSPLCILERTRDFSFRSGVFAPERLRSFHIITLERESLHRRISKLTHWTECFTTGFVSHVCLGKSSEDKKKKKKTFGKNKLGRWNVCHIQNRPIRSCR